MDKLHEFYNDKGMQDAVKAFLSEMTDKQILERAYNGQTTEAAPIVRTVINRSFNELERRYQPKGKDHKKKDRGI